MNKINFHFQSVSFKIANKRRLKKHTANIFNSEKKSLKCLNIIFCTDKYLLKINKKYLHHNYYTDVITFDLSRNRKEIIGEIYISVDRVRENSVDYNKTFRKELNTVIIHGALHLCGYNDRTSKDVKRIRRAENFYLINLQNED